MKVNYQVLYDGDTKEDHGVVDFATKAAARTRAAELRKAGKKNVRVWDCRNNPLSRLLKF